MKTRSTFIVILLMLALILSVGITSAQGGGTTIASGFNGPMGILVASDGSVWVIDSGLGGDEDLPFIDPQTGQEITAKFGETARIVQIASDGTQTVAASMPSVVTGMDTIGGARLAVLNDVVYATSGQFLGDASGTPSPNTAAVVKIEEGEIVEVASTWTLESSQNPDGHLLDTHPYGLAAGPDGNLWVADAAGNDLLKVNPDTGEVEVVAVFEGIPGPLPNPNRGGAMESDPVPTGVTVGQDGNIYVSFLAGFPFIPGTAKVVQVTPDGQVSDYATGLTTLTDVQAAPDGNLYAVQFAEFTEQGPTPNSGRIIRVKSGDASEVVISDLSFPTAIAFNENGDAYVTINGVGAPGSGEVMMFADLVSQPGTPLAAEQPAEADAGAQEAAPSANEPPATLPTAGGQQSTGESPAASLMLLGLSLVAVGLLLRRRLSPIYNQ